MTTLYLIRHAEAEGNAYRRIDGWYNSLITPNGLLQIEALRRRFEPVQIDACYASEMCIRDRVWPARLSSAMRSSNSANIVWR